MKYRCKCGVDIEVTNFDPSEEPTIILTHANRCNTIMDKVDDITKSPYEEYRDKAAATGLRDVTMNEYNRHILPYPGESLYSGRMRIRNARKITKRNIKLKDKRIKRGKCVMTGEKLTEAEIAAGHTISLKTREKRTEYQREYHRKLKEEVIAAYSNGDNRCMCQDPSCPAHSGKDRCEEDDITELTLDHINNNGKEHREKLYNAGEMTTSTEFYQYLRRNGFPNEAPYQLQVLCKTCNQCKPQGPRDKVSI